MENWGLVIYIETTILFVPGVSTQGTEIGVIGIAAHEIAHMVSFF